MSIIFDSAAAPAGAAVRLNTVLLRFLALSAAVPFELLEEKDAQGRHRFGRGRHKYYGIASLVIFFAIFSGYGMGHMLASMSNMSWWGATIAGVLWAVFQWCLERQILLSIRSDASWWKKLFGLSWRTLLALLSASTMVYPFFVESNRAEIDVRVGEMARARLLDNQASAQLAVGLPTLRTDAANLTLTVQQLDKLLASDPPEVPALRKKATQCWARFHDGETQIKRQLRPLQMLRQQAGVDAALDARIDQLQQKIETARAPCASIDHVIAHKIAEWRQQKTAEKREVMEQHKQVQSRITSAKSEESRLIADQSAKIERAASSGFAADFTAVADLVRNDANRRFQLLWWLTWFLAIELVAMVIKLSANTDLDWHLQSEETIAREKTQGDLHTRQEELKTHNLRTSMHSKGEQAVWLADDGKMAQEQLLQALAMDAELKLPLQRLQAHIRQLKEIENLMREANTLTDQGKLHALVQAAIQDLIEKYQTRYLDLGSAAVK